MEESNAVAPEKEIKLPPMLAEFCDALNDEISVARRNAASTAIPLTNGHKVGQQGHAHQYAFQIDTVLNVPEGAPGDLIVPDHAPLNVNLVSVEGLRIVVSVESDLGQFVPLASLRTDLTFLMRKLVDRIQANADADNPAASRMLGDSPVNGQPHHDLASADLDKYQIKALESATGRNLTAIWGPPGTGKTRTIGTISERLYKASRSILIVSHTNAAVDQAIKHVAKSLKEHLADGVVVRVGSVRDAELKRDFPDVLLDTQKERQSHGLENERAKIEAQRQGNADRLVDIQRSIAITEWLPEADTRMRKARDTIASLNEKRHQFRQEHDELTELRRQHSALLNLHQTCTKVLETRKKRLAKQGEQRAIESQLKNIVEDMAEQNALIRNQRARLELLDRLDPLRAERKSYPTLREQKATVGMLAGQLAQGKKELSQAQDALKAATWQLEKARGMNALRRVYQGLPSPDRQKEAVRGLFRNVAALESECHAAQSAHDHANSKLARILEIDGELLRHEGIGTRKKEEGLLAKAKNSLKIATDKREYLEVAVAGLTSEAEELEREENRHADDIPGDAKELYTGICLRLKRLKELESRLAIAEHEISRAERDLTSSLTSDLERAREWARKDVLPTDVGEMLQILMNFHRQLSSRYPADGLSGLGEQATAIDGEISRLRAAIAHIDRELSEIEKRVIMQAKILGATLTKTYLSDDIQARRFDTVILDEASMAPIPALWIAALLAEKNLVLVGDFLQLPPIVQSKKDSTIKWLGRDIFEVAGLRAAWEREKSPEHFIPLLAQRRMLPKIAEVANLFYDGILESPDEIRDDTSGFYDWFASDRGYDSPVLLVDTGPINAWVTSVVRGSSSSRLNFLSATVTVDLAEQLLRKDRPTPEAGSSNRILIVSPYRPHAKLVSIMLGESKHLLRDEVIAGTAHSFQGSEADVVIFDLVVDEPHFRVNLFMPLLDDSLKGLMNVALTRAKFRLIVVGDFAYCSSHAKKAFLGRDLIPFLQAKFPCVSASEVVPNGLAAKAAKAQMAMMRGDIEPDSERIVVTQQDFYRVLAGDLARACTRIVIYSPFITKNRVSMLLSQLQAATDRGVAVTIITKSHQERRATEIGQVRMIEVQLSDIGATVMHKFRMHEKLIFIDDCVTWSGSLNPLSFSNTQEVMERRLSRAVLADYFKLLRLNELLASSRRDECQCPICGSEMMAAEGRKDPYYWRCVNKNCYTRSIDERHPTDGLLTCKSCGEPFEFGYWGDHPCWRCTSNNRHRKKVNKADLRLPKMAALIPQRERHRVCRKLRVDEYNGGQALPNRDSAVQVGLFDD